jgi:hypothetical protein
MLRLTVTFRLVVEKGGNHLNGEGVAAEMTTDLANSSMKSFVHDVY